MNTGTENLSTADRVTRMVFGYALIAAVGAHVGSLGYLALLPLLAIYPMVTASVGFCPIEGAVKRMWSRAAQQNTGHVGHLGRA
jgi:hypothetical protein